LYEHSYLYDLRNNNAYRNGVALIRQQVLCCRRHYDKRGRCHQLFLVACNGAERDDRRYTDDQRGDHGEYSVYGYRQQRHVYQRSNLYHSCCGNTNGYNHAFIRQQVFCGCSHRPFCKRCYHLCMVTIFRIECNYRCYAEHQYHDSG